MQDLYKNIISFLIAIPVAIILFIVSGTVLQNIMDALPDCFSHYIYDDIGDHYIQSLPW